MNKRNDWLSYNTALPADNEQPLPFEVAEGYKHLDPLEGIKTSAFRYSDTRYLRAPYEQTK